MTTSHLRKLLGLALLAAPFTAALGACGVDPPPEARSALAYDTAPQVSDADYAALVAGDNAFATDLYQDVRGDGSANLFFSPHSISTALAMTYAGANGDTATQIAATLHFTLPAAALHPAMDRLALDLASRGKSPGKGKRPFELHQMDSLWAQQDYPIEAPFLDTLATSYDAGVYQLDFERSPDASRGTINDYVADQTEGHIKDLLPPPAVTDATRLVLTNAIYFQASWASPFDANETGGGSFTTASGGTVSVQMMRDASTYAYGEGADYQAVELPYEGNELALDVLLPKGTDGAALAAFEASLTGDRLGTILGSLAKTQVQLSLPKVSFTAALSLKDTLVAMGMVIPFALDGSADFTGITTLEPLHIDAVEHKGFVAIDEDGTTATAATAVSIGTGAAAPEGVLVTADHPYVVVLRDLQTGAILFLGRVSDPTKS